MQNTKESRSKSCSFTTPNGPVTQADGPQCVDMLSCVIPANYKIDRPLRVQRMTVAMARPDKAAPRLSPDPSDPPSMPSAAPPRRATLLQFIPRFGAGIFQDIHARAPWYLSDWTDAWNYRVVPATTLIFFAKYDLVSVILYPRVA